MTTESTREGASASETSRALELRTSEYMGFSLGSSGDGAMWQCAITDTMVMAYELIPLPGQPFVQGSEMQRQTIATVAESPNGQTDRRTGPAAVLRCVCPLARTATSN